MFDSHCHLDLPVFDADRSEVLARAAAAGVRTILVPAIRPATFARVTAIASAAAAPLVVHALGVHPQVVAELDADETRWALDPDAIARSAVESGAVAIGECGLDGGTPEPALQERIFRAHVRAARLARLPLVVHVLRAHGLAPRLLREEGVAEVGGVMHSYSGGADLIEVYAEMGLSFSLAGPISFPGARRPVEAARAIAGDRLLAETDAPDQTPHPHRGQRNEPAHVGEIVAALAAARHEDPATIAALTEANAERLFRLPKRPRAAATLARSP